MAKLLAMAFFPAFTPAASGGELRLGHLYRALSAQHDITLLTSTDFNARFEDIQHTPRLRELRFPKDRLWREAYATLERSGVCGELSGLAFALAVSDPSCRLRQVARDLASEVDFIVHEFPFSEPVFGCDAPRPEIYNAHNFELSLLPSVVYGHGVEAALLKLMRLEANLAARAHRVFATSAEDAEKFRLFYGVDPQRLALCPNGFDDTELAGIAAARAAIAPGGSLPSGRPRLLFTGSAHPPNVDAALFLAGLAGQLPHCDIILAGAVCGALNERQLAPNLTLFGPFDATAKVRLLLQADIFLNPVTLGSGTSLKALEALGAGLPMVSTPEGARGLGLVSGEQASLVARPDFAATIDRLLADPDQLARIGAAGRAYACGAFSWTRIAADVSAALDAPPGETSPLAERKLVLALNDYPVGQAQSGGAARIRNLHETLGIDTVLVTFGSACSVALVSPTLLLVTVARTAAHQAYQTAVNSGQSVSVDDGVASLFAASNRLLVAIAASLARRAGAVVFEHPYMAPLLEAIRRVAPEIPVIYSAHNVEATHKAEMLRSHPAAATLINFIAEVEAILVAGADLVVCCTEADAAHFRQAHPTVIVAPNGCVVPEAARLHAARLHAARLHAARDQRGPDAPPRIGFMGSAHRPNVVAAEGILRDLVPLFPDLVFEIVGGVCSAISPASATPSLPNVVLHGVVDEAEKTRILAGWTLALNPIESGGGSSLKLADFMAHGLPTINTVAGARGFDVVARNAGQIGELSQFADLLLRALANPRRLQEQGANAYRYAAEALSWSACTAAYRDRLHRKLAAPDAPFDAAAAASRSLLVVTYRYTEPPLGGAEEYLIEILKQMRPLLARLDLAAIDTGSLTNQHHFATRVGEASQGGGGQGTTARLGELFDYARYFPPDPPCPDLLARSRRLQRAWSREELALFAPFAARLHSADRVRLFAGFYGPEHLSGTVRRWTAPEFSFLVPPGSLVFRLAGYGSVPKLLRLICARIAADGTLQPLAETEWALPVWFSQSFSLPKTAYGEPVAVLCRVEEHLAEGDHRPLGVFLESVSVTLDRTGTARNAAGGIGVLVERTADLQDQIEPEMRQDLAAWVAALRAGARRHSDQMEADFAAVRGPHATALLDWLRAHAAQYDTVLVQGIPFDVIPSVVETLAALPARPRLVTLPHFHGDDRFYHWQRYFDSFALADSTLLFSSAVAQALALPARIDIVPGGGVRTDEHGDPTARQRFREVLALDRPYFLVLGRKTASKGYARIIAAQQKLRRQGVAVDLVLIGPDEDGHEVKGDGVHALGRQPREEVRGALLDCVALVSMSSSESFGIVLCEAWLFGKPVIANQACSSFRELVRTPKDDPKGGPPNGLLVRSDEELVAAMAQLASDPLLRARLGQEGFRTVQKHYTWPAVADAVLQVLFG